jgi:membrane fusion protein, multidrug efflux system
MSVSDRTTPDAVEPVDPPTRAPATAPRDSTTAPATQPAAVTPTTARRAGRRRRSWIIGGATFLVALVVGGPRVLESFSVVSTDDAYVNGHVTFVAPRVAGRVVRVLVEDNNRVRKGDLLVQLDKEPYQVQVNIAQAAVTASRANLVTAQAEVRGAEGQVRSLRFNLEQAIEDVDNRVALLRSKVAILAAQRAALARAKLDYERVLPLLDPSVGGVTQEEVDNRKQAMLGAQAQVEAALEDVHQIRAGLGLSTVSGSSDDLTRVPPDLDQTFSGVRQAQASLIQAAAQLGVTGEFNQTPRQMIAEFYKRDPTGDINRIFAQLLKDAPAVKEAEARLAETQRNLDQAELNLRYCDVRADIDGVVTRRNVNPGDYVVVGQSLMAVRSLTEIWVDANFKETQLRSLRIGQAVDLDADMYGSRHRFHGRISGFTMGTGSTLALLPPENATGNFVKVVQRLPVRIELLDYDPNRTPLFVGLSVTATAHLNEPPTGPDAGKVLQPYARQTPAHTRSKLQP